MILPEGVSGAAFGAAADGDPRRDGEALVRVSAELGIAVDWAWVRQVHGASVIEADSSGIIGDGDAIFTSVPGLPLAVSVADCLPVALLAADAVGIAHAGWRGAAAGVVTALAGAMRAAGHAVRQAVIGPGIRSCCFEVGPEVEKEFPRYVASTSWGTSSVDLGAAVAAELAGTAVRDIAACTHHDDRFVSYRRDGSKLRQFGVTWLSTD